MSYVLFNLTVKNALRGKITNHAQKCLKGIRNESGRFYSEKATLHVEKEYLLHKLDKGPEMECTMTKEDGLECYKQMVTIRKMEQAASKLYQEKVIRGFLHLYSGQEACAIGIRHKMRKQDDIIGGYRIHGVAYLMGATVKQILAELAGKSSGTQMGKGGSMHLYLPHFFGGHGIVAAQVPVGTGVAFASKYRENGGVCFVLFGDGALNQGQVYESFNMAKLWKLPVIYIVENNGYAMGTAVERGSGLIDLYKRGHYIPGLWVDGMDLCATINAAKFAIDYALKEGPILMEFATYRYYGHSMSDPGTSYRTREEVKIVRDTKDPINLFKINLTKLGITENETKAIDNEVRKDINKIIQEVKKEKELPLSDLAADVCVNKIEKNVRNNVAWKPIPHKNLRKALNPK